jgi:hypothetical protein
MDSNSLWSLYWALAVVKAHIHFYRSNRQCRRQERSYVLCETAGEAATRQAGGENTVYRAIFGRAQQARRSRLASKTQPIPHQRRARRGVYQDGPVLSR